MPLELPTLLNPTNREFEDPKITVNDVSKADMRTISAFVDIYHQNNRTHVNVGIDGDKDWQKFWNLLTSLLKQWYNLPTRFVGQIFLDNPTTHTNRVVNQKWKLEQLIVFPDRDPTMK